MEKKFLIIKNEIPTSDTFYESESQIPPSILREKCTCSGVVEVIVAHSPTLIVEFCSKCHGYFAKYMRIA